MICEDLRKVSDLGREALLGTVQSSGDLETDNSLFEATVKEVEKGSVEKGRPSDAQTEGVTIHTIDHIAAMTSWWMRSGSLTPDDALVPNAGASPMLTNKSHCQMKHSIWTPT